MAESDYKTKIVIEGDSKDAADAIKEVSGGLESLLRTLNIIRNIAGRAMRAVGLFYLAFEGGRRIVNILSALKTKLDDIQTSAARTRLAASVAEATAETNRLVSARSALNDKLKEELEIMQRRNSLRDMAQSGETSFGDEQRRIGRALALAGEADPNRRRLLQDQFAAEDEARANATRVDALGRRIGDLDAEESAYSGKASGAASRIKDIDAQIAAEEKLYKLYRSDESRKAAEERLMALRAEREVAVKEKATFEEEAAYRRAQIQLLEKERSQLQALGLYSAAEAQANARWRDENTAQQREQSAFAQRMGLKAADEQWQRDYAAASQSEKVNMLREREDAARERYTTGANDLSAEMSKDVRERNAQRIAELRSNIESAQGDMFSARRERESLAAAAEGRLDSFAGAFMGAAAPSGNRLTAMGLGAGAGVARVQEQMATSLKDLVKAAKVQIEELRAIKDAPNVAVFAE